MSGRSGNGLVKTISALITERNCLIFLLAVFLIVSIAIALIPYNPAEDKADATTNDIWVEYYSKGVFHIPYDDWHYPPTQSVVVEHDGQLVVVNEKGPGHVMMLLPFYFIQMEFLFAPFMVGLAVFSTYMLGKRLVNWRVGIISAVLVLTNVTILVMSYHYYWTDASTVHVLILSVWLMVESMYWLNGRTLDHKSTNEATRKEQIYGAGFGILSGFTFGLCISTRYPTALVLIAMIIFVITFYAYKYWPKIKKLEIKDVLKGSASFWIILAMFFLGLMLVLIPLMNYNTEYFGEPLGSGYDETLIMNFDPSQGIDPRNTTTDWVSSLSTGLSNAASNFVILLPVLIMRMPALLLLPIGIWVARKKPYLVLLLLWIVINFFTYLSLAWVDMYAQMPSRALHEPRYFMPSIPAIALLGALAIDYIAPKVTSWLKSDEKFSIDGKRFGKIAVTMGVTGILALSCIIPAANYLYNVNDLREQQRPPPDQRPVLVSTDDLLLNPTYYAHEFVIVENAEIVSFQNNIVIRSEGAQLQRGITVRLDGWPPNEIPDFSVGQRANVQGLFIYDTPPDRPPRLFINVKYDTNDFIRILP